MELKSNKVTETNKSELIMQVSPEELNEAVNHVFKQESRKINVPGFRKGHAPRAFIEKYYGEGVFFEAALNHMYRDIVNGAIEKSGLEVVAVSDFKVDDISKENGVSCTVQVVTKPEVTVENYKGIELYREPVVATDGDIDAEIERVRERNSRIVTVEDRAAENGDITVIDYDGYVDDKQFDGGKAENFELTLGSGQFIPGFEEQVVGHNTGEEFDISVTFPEDYHAEELKGKPAVFKIKLHEIKKKELPEVDDEFVKDVSEFDTLEEYRRDLEKNILERREKAADADIENQIADAILEKTVAEIPNEMIEIEIDQMIDNLAYRLQSQGLKLETYLKYTNATTDDLRAQYRPNAEQQVKLRLGLEKIGKLEDIKPTEEETEEEYKTVADSYGMPVESVKNLVSEESINLDIVTRKTIEFVKANANITLPKKDNGEEEKKPAKKSGRKSGKKSAEKPEEKSEEKIGEKTEEEK